MKSYECTCHAADDGDAMSQPVRKSYLFYGVSGRKSNIVFHRQKKNMETSKITSVDGRVEKGAEISQLRKVLRVILSSRN